MSANFQHNASRPGKGIPIIKSGTTEAAVLADDGRAMHELVWVLISILLSLYVATGYVYWAKIECAWPLFR